MIDSEQETLETQLTDPTKIRNTNNPNNKTIFTRWKSEGNIACQKNQSNLNDDTKGDW